MERADMYVSTPRNFIQAIGSETRDAVKNCTPGRVEQENSISSRDIWHF
jgi:putative IMPACT (imprinted ancient) family translation regulator